MKMDNPYIAVSAPKSAALQWLKARECLARFLTMILLGLALQQLDPFGFLNYTEKKTFDLFNFVMGPQIPATWNEEVAVVLIDDIYVEKYSEWPMPFIEHARVLTKMLQFEPRAVFVDLLFTKDKDVKGIAPLILALRQYQNKGIPVFATAPESRSGMLPQLSRLIIPVTTRLERDQVDYLDYSLWRQGSMTNQAPANALIAEYCARTPRDPGRHKIWGEACNRILDHKSLSLDSEPMMLLWGTERAEANEDSFRCNDRIGDNWQRQVINWFSLSHEETLQKCPRYPTLLLDNLLGGFPDDKLSEYLSDKIVFYGPEIEGATVWTTPPTHEALSATYTHATALENLLIYGNDYFARDRTVLGLSVRTTFEYSLWLILCLAISFRVVGLSSIAPKSTDSILYVLLFDISSYVVLCVLVFSLTATQSYVFNIAPINFLGVLSLVFAITSIQESKYFAALEGFFQKLMRTQPFNIPSPERKNP